VQGPHEPVDHYPAAVRILIRGVGLAACLAAAVAASAQAADQLTALPSPFFPVRASPPVPVSPVATETRFPGRLSSSQVVRVSIDASGRPLRIVDVDRIVVAAKGDYSFVVSAPIEDVWTAPGSGSVPGLRSNAVVWQGFSPGHRVLGAEITLRTAAAAPALPLRVERVRGGIRLLNRTSATATTVDASAPTLEIARALDAARAAVAAGTPIPAAVVDATGPIKDIEVAVRMPLRVSGTLRFGGQPPRRFVREVGGRAVEITGPGAVQKLSFSVAVPDPVSALSPPGASRWVGLARSGRLPSGRGATRLAVRRLLAAALSLQVAEFIANPDVNGVTRTTYRYQLATPGPAPAAAESAGTDSWVLPVVVVVGLALAIIGGLIVWAHS
jgi:hypothetical protein